MHRRLLQTLTPLFATALTAGFAHAATVPYTETFDDDTLGTSTPSEPAPESGTFTPTASPTGANPGSASSDWAVVLDGAGPDQNYENELTVTTGTSNDSYIERSSSGLDFTGSIDSTSFEIATDLRVDSQTPSGDEPNFVGLFARSTDDGITTTNSYHLRYFTHGSNAGKLQLIGGSVNSTSAAAASFTVGTDYRLTLTGTVVGSDLQLTGTIVEIGNATNTTTVAESDTAPLTGAQFGYRNQVTARGDTQTASLNVDFDNFSAVPEPASLALLGLGSLLMLSRRRD